jgi:hypothetical protein
MIDSEKEKFAQLMMLAGLAHNKEISKTLIALYWHDLKKFEFQEVRTSFDAHRRSEKFFPSVADIFEKIPSSSLGTHIGADEAWQIAVDSLDERRTVAMTRQIAEARGIAIDLVDFGDKTAARMAFRDAYNRLIASNPDCEWFISEGFDKSTRAAAVEKAVSLGRLPAIKHQNFIEHHPDEYIGIPTDRKKALE